MVKEASPRTSLSSIPDPALSRLDGLVGVWDITGRMPVSQPGNVTRWSTFDWLPGRFFQAGPDKLSYEVVMTQVSHGARAMPR